MEQLINEAYLESVIRRMVDRELEKRASGFGKRTKPYTSTEFAKETGMPYSTVRRKVQAKLIATTPDGRIPASEYERLVNAE